MPMPPGSATAEPGSNSHMAGLPRSQPGKGLSEACDRNLRWAETPSQPAMESDLRPPPPKPTFEESTPRGGPSSSPGATSPAPGVTSDLGCPLELPTGNIG